MGPSGLISRHASAGSTFYQFDPQGNVCNRLTSGGGNMWSGQTDPFGNVNNPPPAGDPFGYEGQVGYYTDQSSGLVLCTYRYYDPSVGRWVNRDPIGYDGGVNLYAYVKNSPVDRNDPFGLFELGIGIGGGFGGGIGPLFGGGLTGGIGIAIDTNGTLGITYGGGSVMGGFGEFAGGGLFGTVGTGNLGSVSCGQIGVVSGPYPVFGGEGHWGPVDLQGTHGGGGYNATLSGGFAEGGFIGPYVDLGGSFGINLPNLLQYIRSRPGPSSSATACCMSK